MITLVGALLGLLSSTLPNLLKLWQDRQDKAHELAVLTLQMGRDAAGHGHRLAEIEAMADVAETAALHRPQPATGLWLVDLLNGLVRPVITLAFFALYGAVKWGQLETILQAAADIGLSEALIRVWHEEDMALFSAILAYWFGQRGMRRAMGRLR